MRIAIAARLKPFSHTPGARCVIPGTHLILEAFPTFLRIDALEIPLEVQGPVRHFTLQQDLERDCVWVFGDSFRVQIVAFTKVLTMRRGSDVRTFPLQTPFFLPTSWERLSLGSHKTQDWDLVLRRFKLQEILPILFAIGQKIPPLPPQPPINPQNLMACDIECFCRAALHHIYPTWSIGQGDPFFLLGEATRRFRALFLLQEGSRVQLLPNCPFAAGRMTNVRLDGVGTLDFEWRAHRVRRAILHAHTKGEIALNQTFRLRQSFRERGRVFEASSLLQLEAGQTYFLDRNGAPLA